MNNLAVALVALLFTACSLGPAVKDTPAIYDLGAPRTYTVNLPRIHAGVLLHNVAAPAWLDTPGIIYRLNYENAARQQTYATSRWASAPALLLAQRLRGRLAAASDASVIGVADGARADYSLRVELEEFSQVFDAADVSRVVVMARASIVNMQRRSVEAQKSFIVERPAVSPNAEGGVKALTVAADDLVEAIVAWVAASLPMQKK
jgi:cholesterol transport system auxiliary component